MLVDSQVCIASAGKGGCSPASGASVKAASMSIRSRSSRFVAFAPSSSTSSLALCTLRLSRCSLLSARCTKLFQHPFLALRMTLLSVCLASLKAAGCCRLSRVACPRFSAGPLFLATTTPSTLRRLVDSWRARRGSPPWLPVCEPPPCRFQLCCRARLAPVQTFPPSTLSPPPSPFPVSPSPPSHVPPLCSTRLCPTRDGLYRCLHPKLQDFLPDDCSSPVMNQLSSASPVVSDRMVVRVDPLPSLFLRIPDPALEILHRAFPEPGVAR